MEGVMRGRSARADELKAVKPITHREVSKDGMAAMGQPDARPGSHIRNGVLPGRAYTERISQGKTVAGCPETGTTAGERGRPVDSDRPPRAKQRLVPNEK
jgi:hypothetical protein